MMSHFNLTQNHKHLLKAIIFGLGLSFSLQAEAVCGKGIAETSMYYLPSMYDFGCKDHTSSSKACRSFRSAVNMQGSGKISGNRVLRYNGAISKMGSCETTKGAAGTCLKPFISIAADPAHHRMGDVIEIPHFKGKEFTLPDGTTFIHPGYFVVEDVGGAIKGKGRFDFFTGTYNLQNPKNPLGHKGPPDMRIFADKTKCTSSKAYTHHKKGSGAANSALAAIENALSGNVVASSPRPAPRPTWRESQQ